jgi:uncharacterized protein with NAD-binding domain and iron-sulfur cluster
MSPRIVIVGGGLAGLAAAVALTDRGVSCTLLESRPRLGGRASSFHDPTTGTDIDNCQHVTLGCCTNFRHFCQTTGIAEFFRRESALYFAGPSGKIDRVAAGSLPAPLHLTGAFARLSYLSWSDKLALARGLKELARPLSEQDESRPFAEWLRQHGQTETAIQRFWFVVLVSALSESLDRISVGHARKVFVDAFLANRDGWYVDIPTVPLEELYGGRLTDWLTSRGAKIRLQASAEQVEMADDRVNGIRLSSNEVVPGDESSLCRFFESCLFCHRYSKIIRNYRESNDLRLLPFQASICGSMVRSPSCPMSCSWIESVNGCSIAPRWERQKKHETRSRSQLRHNLTMLTIIRL